jgi:thioredoxin reductase (NADPH)
MYDIIIIGGGAAGMTAALYSLRSGKSVLLIERETIGGQISKSPRVENFPSIKEISGTEFSDKLFDQIMDLGCEFELDNVLKLEKENNTFKVYGEYNNYQSKAVIIATGLEHRKINVEPEDELIGKGVSYCAVCDGAFYKDEEVCLIGDANTALQYSLLLSNYCKKVYVCTLFDKFFADDILVSRLRKRENVEIYHNLLLKEFKYSDELEGVVFENTQDLTKKEFTVKACFIAIGQIPNNDIFSNLVELDKNGYILVDNDLQTKTEGLFVAGDCRQKKVRQLTTAVSDGAMASVGAVSYIDKNFN